MNIDKLPYLLSNIEILRSDIIISPQFINREDLLKRLDKIIMQARGHIYEPS